jgi:hypothetical protein
MRLVRHCRLLAGLLCLGLGPQAVFAGDMVSIEYRDHEPNAPDYVSRYLLLDDRLRMDYGRDGDDFVLFDRRAARIAMVSHSARRVTELAVELSSEAVPDDWNMLQVVRPARGGKELRLRVKNQDCVIVRSIAGTASETALLADFKRALSGNQRDAWRSTPADLQEPCHWLMEVAEAGIEYRYGLPAEVNYWDGRTRRYLNRRAEPARAQLFEVPRDYAIFRVGQSSQSSSQPAAVQSK